VVEAEEARPVRRPRRRVATDDSDDPLATIVPYKNAKALLAYYCGVFSLVPVLGLILGPLALILGILGLRYAGRNPRAKGVAHAIVGIVLGSLTALANWGVAVLILAGILLHK
jgi:hypothetical protein